MTTLQEKRHRETTTSMWRAVAQRDACITKLVRCELKLDRLRKLLARQTKALTKARATGPKPGPQPMAPPAPKPEPAPLTPTQIADVKASRDELLEIPTFLDKRNLIADPKTKDRNAERRVIEKEKREAKLTGKLKQMPLTGRAALDKIRAG